MNAFAAGSSADISAQNIDVNPNLLTKNQSKQFALHDGAGPSVGSYVPVSAMSGIAGMGPSSSAASMGLGGPSGIAGSTEDIYGMSNQQTSSTMPQGSQSKDTKDTGFGSAQSSGMKKGPFLFNEPSAEDLSQGFEDPVDAQAQPLGSAAPGLKSLGKRESGSLEGNNLQALSQPGQRLGNSNPTKGPDLSKKGSGVPQALNPQLKMPSQGAQISGFNSLQPGENTNMMDRYYNSRPDEDDGIPEDQSNNNESLDAVNISTPGTYGNNFQGRPQTSHGRVRKNVAPVNGIQKREEKQTGLGETSVQNWDETKETDVSRQ